MDHAGDRERTRQRGEGALTCTACGAALPADARFCPACGAAVEAPRAPPSEERKLATVLFADLVGSTEFGEQDPERTRAVLDRFYDAMAAEIAAAGGTVEKFAGDAVMAVFGAPAALEDHAERALHAALAMLRRLEPPLRLRIGVNTGDVVVGRPREGSSFVTGDAVNVAARLEQAAGPGEILAGERTVAAARGAFEFEEPQAVEAKGKERGVACRPVVRALSLMRPRGVGGLHQAFVGRDIELDLLRVTYRRVAERREPHLVTIMGDAGVGKTRLVRELWQMLGDESPEPMRRTGRCLSYGHGITYWPLAEVLKEHFGIVDTDPPARILERLRGREMLALALGLDVARELHPLAARERLHEAAVEFLQELAAARPVVMLVEDLHWAEDELLELVDRLLLEVDGPLFLLGTSRPEILDMRSSWGGGRRNVSLIGLEPLTGRQTEEMVSELLAAELPAPVQDALVERAGGNPFFVEELVGTLIDRGLLERSNGSWTARRLPEGFEIPDSVQAVLAARIDLLPPREKEALQAASVIGRIFWTGPVRELVEEDPDFALLEERDFIRRRSGSSLPGEREFAIKHALTREVAYASLPKAKRARLHAAFADWIERSGEARDEYAAILGHHYAEAVRPADVDLAWGGEETELERLRGKALHWLERAGDLAVGRYEVDDGIALLRRAIELEPEDQKKAELWRRIGRASAMKFDGEAFWTAMQSSLETCYDRAVCADTYSWLALQTVLRSGMWRRLPDHDLVEGWIDAALQGADDDSASRARALVARCIWARDARTEDAEEAMRIAELHSDPELLSFALSAKAMASFMADRFEEAHGDGLRQLELVDQISDPDHLTDVFEDAIAWDLLIGRFADAEAVLDEHERLTTSLSNHHRLHSVAIRLELEEARGDWARIRELTPHTRAAVQQNLVNPCVRNMRSLLVSAVAAAIDGDDAEAHRLEEEGESLGMEGHDDALRAPRLRLALLRGDLGRAGELLLPRRGTGRGFRKGHWFFAQTFAVHLDALVDLGLPERVEEDAPAYAIPGTYLEPFSLRALGRVREDEELIQRALERFEAMGLDWHAEQTRALLEA